MAVWVNWVRDCAGENKSSGEAHKVVVVEMLGSQGNDGGGGTGRVLGIHLGGDGGDGHES